MLRIINILTYALVGLIVAAQTCFAQEKKVETATNSIYMTWNKDTPESEMNDDIKALAKEGVTITYSDVKRNDKNEITGLKVAYADQKGNKGSMDISNQKPINTIRFYKQGDEMGFGNPSNSDSMVFANGEFFNGQDFMKNFNFNNGGGTQSYSFSFPEGIEFGDSQRIVIKKDGKKPLIIENGEVLEGGEDYTTEEIEAIKKNNKAKIYQYGGFGSNFKGLEELEGLQGLEELKDLEIRPGERGRGQKELSKEELNSTRDEMIKAKEEMIKAKKEMEKAKKDLQKAKSSLKTQKA